MKGKLCRPQAGFGIYVAASTAFPPDPSGRSTFQANWRIFEGVDVRVARMVEEVTEPYRFLNAEDALDYAESRARAHLLAQRAPRRPN